MFDFKKIILPLIVGIFGGFGGPLLVEKWKGSESAAKQQIVMATELKLLNGKLNDYIEKTDKRLSTLEEEVKSVEIKQVQNLGTK